MNIHEGSRRMQRAGQWLIAIPVSVVLLCVMAASVVALAQGRLSDIGFRLSAISFCIPLVIPGLALWIAGWIVEGFAKGAN